MTGTRLAVLLTSALALALAGVPTLGPARPVGPLRGVVIDSAGFALVDAQVFLFAEEEERLYGETRTDAAGEFDFALVPPHPRVFVRAPAGSGRLDAFGPPAEDCGATLAFVLQRARPLAVQVHDERGAPLAGAEVRVYEERTEAAVVALARTDEQGKAQLPAPARAHVAVVAPDETGLMRWKFELEVPEDGLELDFELPTARRLQGFVRAAGQPVSGVELVLWQDGLDGGWNGFTTSAADGSFCLPWTRGPATLRALDPAGRFLPARRALDPEEPGEPQLELTPGTRRVVRTSRQGLPFVARVFAWSEEAEAWGYGPRTNGAGRVELPVDAHFGLHVAPLDPALEPIECWDVPPGPDELRLEPKPRRP